MLSEDRSYSLQAIERLLGGMPGVPRIGFSFVDVRDVADLEIRAMTDPEAGGERFVAVETFHVDGRGRRGAARAPGRGGGQGADPPVPDLLVRVMALFDPGVRSIVGQLGRKTELSSEKAKARLGWSPRPLEDTIVECAQSLL